MTDEMPGDWTKTDDYTFVNEFSHETLYIAIRPDTEKILICVDDEILDETEQSLGKALSIARQVMGRHPLGT